MYTYVICTYELPSYPRMLRVVLIGFRWSLLFGGGYICRYTSLQLRWVSAFYNVGLMYCLRALNNFSLIITNVKGISSRVEVHLNWRVNSITIIHRGKPHKARRLLEANALVQRLNGANLLKCHVRLRPDEIVSAHIQTRSYFGI